QMKLYVKELASQIPATVLKVCQTYKDNGFQCWLVGGCLRDYFLVHNFQDIDLATDALPAETQDLFAHTTDIGSAYGTILVKEDGMALEVTTLRQEDDYADGRHPEQVVFAKDLKADLARRDFTVNSLAYDPLSRELFDHYNGLNDLQNKLLKTVGDPRKRFREDGLRLMRACRFIAQLGFELEDQTFLALQETKNALKKISQERTASEFNKLIEAPFAEDGLRAMLETGLLEIKFPELASFSEEQWQRSWPLLKLAEPGWRSLVLAKLISDEQGIKTAERFLQNLKYNKAQIASYLLIIANLRILYDKQATDSALRAFIQKIGKGNTLLWLKLYQVFDSLYNNHSASELKKMEKRFQELCLDPLTIEELALKGDDLLKMGIPKGPRIGQIMRKLLEIVIEYPQKNSWSQLIGYAKELSNMP
ncbi:MAG: CCA tRNA nucleotidyltransferase, partial [Candidatus Margulisiibacteriota bacterium]